MWIAIAAVAAIAVLAHTAPFPFLFDAISPDRVVWKMPARGTVPAIYLTFDDGPNPDATPQVLDALERHGARATFFLIDDHVNEATAPIVRRMFADGHGVALHSGHRWLMTKSGTALAALLAAFADRVEAVSGQRPCRAFRPHGGNRSRRMLNGLASADYQLVGWSWFGWDWNWGRRRTGESVARRLAARASDGFIAVVHDGHHANPNAERGYAAQAVDRLVPTLRARGFEFRTICEDLEAVTSAGEAARPAKAAEPSWVDRDVDVRLADALPAGATR
jgi:peptidoglycan/xylan/chitin deacetylase (PgdA/CDA1 family)